MNSRALIIGSLLNQKYRIEGILGEGGFGITYVATDTLINELVAIKEYFPTTLASRDTTNGATTDITIITGNDTVNFEKGLSKFEDEAANLAKFQNVDGIVKVKNFFRENNTGYMVMEYIDGMSLNEYLKSVGGKLEYSQVLSMMEPIMDALTQVHKASIIHRDINPDNIMVTKDNQLKLIDFGAARYIGNEDEKSLTIMLKEGYAPPEQYRSDGKQGPWTDVYALCATMYRMITGQVPIDSVSRVLDKDSLKPIGEFADVPKHVEKAIMEGLKTAYNKRILTVDQLKENVSYYLRRKNWVIPSIMLIILLIIIIFFKSFNSQNDNSINSKQITTYENEEIVDEIKRETKEIIEYETISEESENLLEVDLIKRIEEFSKLKVYSSLYDDYDNDGQHEMFAIACEEEMYEDISYDETGYIFYFTEWGDYSEGVFYLYYDNGCNNPTLIDKYVVDKGHFGGFISVLQCGKEKIFNLEIDDINSISTSVLCTVYNSEYTSKYNLNEIIPFAIDASVNVESDGSLYLSYGYDIIFENEKYIYGFLGRPESLTNHDKIKVWILNGELYEERNKMMSKEEFGVMTGIFADNNLLDEKVFALLDDFNEFYSFAELYIKPDDFICESIIQTNDTLYLNYINMVNTYPNNANIGLVVVLEKDNNKYSVTDSYWGYKNEKITTMNILPE